MRERGYESIDSSEDNKKEFFKIASHILKNSGLFQGVEAFILLMIFK